MSNHSGERGQVTVPRFMAYDEGCYECGEPSGVIGFYTSAAEALTAVEVAMDRQQANWKGQHDMFVIDLASPRMSEHAPEQSGREPVANTNPDTGTRNNP